jgi:predicted PurR-regulated permease PerM
MPDPQPDDESVARDLAPPDNGRRGRGRIVLDRPLAIAFVATLGVLGALLVGFAIASVVEIIVYIVLALFVALGLDPLVRMLQRRGLKRGLGIAIVFGGLSAIIVTLLVFLVPAVLAQIADFFTSIPAAMLAAQEADWFLALPEDARAALAGGLDEAAHYLAQPSTFAAITGGALAVGVGIISGITASFIVAALTVYFLASLTSMKRALYALAPARDRATLEDLTERVTQSVGSSLIGSVILSTINAAVVFVLHLILGLPFAALMAVIAFVITLIPLFGSVIFWVFGSVIALFSSPWQALAFGLLYLVYIQLESYVVSPRVMNRAVSIPAALVLIGALAGGALLGVLGVILAVPVMASALLVLREVVIPKQDLKV